MTNSNTPDELDDFNNALRVNWAPRNKETPEEPEFKFATAFSSPLIDLRELFKWETPVAIFLVLTSAMGMPLTILFLILIGVI